MTIDDDGEEGVEWEYRCVVIQKCGPCLMSGLDIQSGTG